MGVCQSRTSTTPETDVDLVLERMFPVIQSRGFVKAMEHFHDDIIFLFKLGSLRGVAHDRFLLKLVMKDEELLRHVEALPQKVTNDMLRLLTDSETKVPRIISPNEVKFHMAKVFRTKTKGDPQVMEGNGRGEVPYVENHEFQNWGRTVDNVPTRTYIPTTKEGVKSIVRWAKNQGKRVRVSGYRHSWSNIFSDNGEVLISLMPLSQAEDLPWEEPEMDLSNELQGIEIVEEIEENGEVKALCRVGAATSNEMFRKWIIENSRESKRKKKWKDWWTLPLNIIMVEITMGGSNGPICHGAGIKHKTLSDLVASIEFVNANAELQLVNDPEQLRAAAGCFGLLGVVTSITLKLDKLTFANFAPAKTRVGLTIPPPEGYDIPAGVDMKGITENDLQKAREDFVKKCENDYYAEWFWFPSSADCWVNCWNNDGNKDDAVDYPSPVQVKVQQGLSYITELLNSYVFPHLPESVQLHLLTSFSMRVLPTASTVTPLIDALHFRRGIQDMRVRDMEWEIPIPGLPGTPSKPDWSICQRAWWDVITAFYKRYNVDKNDVPMRLTLEMRVFSNSNVWMAPVYGNQHGTCSIEILTPENADPKKWNDFLQEITDIWLSYTDENDYLLNCRPHWAKEWEGLKVRNKPIIQYLREDAYRSQISGFQTAFAAVASEAGTKLSDVQATFSNPLFEEILGPNFYT